MNIVEIKTGKYYDPDYSEYHFKTNRPKREIYDENFNLTTNFLDWLRRNHTTIYNEYICDRNNFEIDYFYFDDIEMIP
jgi:hypothetical protein